MAVVRKLPCTVRSVRDHGERVYSVELEPPARLPRFRPGQFLHLALDAYEPGEFWPESRVFSIASSPAASDLLSITYAVKGSFTARMERELAPGRTVWVKLPYGEFVIDGGTDVVLFAGGTGVTAFTAFLGGLLPDHARRVLLFYGARNDDLFVYRGLVETCSARVPSFCCSLLAEDRQGRLSVDAAWKQIEELAEPVFYLSGPPAMLAALTTQLSERGVPAARMRTDAWE
jgi:ferredoxin-NADP reductase